MYLCVFWDFKPSFCPQQSKSSDLKRTLAASVGDGVESLCNCEFAASNLKEISLQCYSDYPAKIFVSLTIQATATKSIPELLDFIYNWIITDPRIVLDGHNTSVLVDKGCDITILGSECVPTGTPPTPSPSPEVPSELKNPSTASQSQDLKTGVAVLTVFTALFLFGLVVAVAVLLVVIFR